MSYDTVDFSDVDDTVYTPEKSQNKGYVLNVNFTKTITDDLSSNDYNNMELTSSDIDSDDSLLEQLSDLPVTSHVKKAKDLFNDLKPKNDNIGKKQILLNKIYKLQTKFPNFIGTINEHDTYQNLEYIYNKARINILKQLTKNN